MKLEKLTLLIGNFFLLYSIVSPVHAAKTFSIEEQERTLTEKLFNSYNKKQKPDGSLQIKFALNLNQIVSVKSKDQVLMLNCFLDHEWIDNRLIWGKIKYSKCARFRRILPFFLLTKFS